MSLEIISFQNTHIPQAIDLWKRTPGLGLSQSDEPLALEKFLIRNPGLSWVLLEDDRLIATALAGHDGRRGFLYHVAVEQSYQGRGLGKKLVKKALEALDQEGIDQVRIFVKANNQTGKIFWKKTGWKEREDISLFAYPGDFPLNN